MMDQVVGVWLKHLSFFFKSKFLQTVFDILYSIFPLYIDMLLSNIFQPFCFCLYMSNQLYSWYLFSSTIDPQIFYFAWTGRYVAPEVILNEEYDTKVDVFSFALILQEVKADTLVLVISWLGVILFIVYSKVNKCI